MEKLIEFIMSNLFLIIIIIAGIMSFLGNQQKEKQNEQKKKQGPQTRQSSIPPERKQAESRGQQLGRMSTESQAPMKSVEEQQQEQMERLADQFQTETKERVDELTENVDMESALKEIQTDNSQQEKQQLKRQMRDNLKGKGLMSGIIMSEVLGPPRAIKPYRNVIHERKRK